MRHAEEVTFGGSGLDRAAEMRGKDAELTGAPSTRTIVLWRGKPLVRRNPDRSVDVLRLPMDHPILSGITVPPILIGREDAGMLLAHDISEWTPPDLDAAQLGGFLDTTEQEHPAAPDAHFAELRRIMTRLTARDAEVASTAKAVYSWHGSHLHCAKCGTRSQMVQSGWQRSCPQCNAQHFPRTDPVVIMLITRGNDTLLGRSPGWPEGMYSCLAGFVEPGETIEAAVRREVFEEAGIRVGAVRYLASQPWAFPTSLMFGCAGEALNADITVDPAELDDARWVSREEVAAAMAGESDWLMPARKGAIAHFMLRNWLADRLD